ncbi:MAG: tyrosine recombinase [Bacteroidetes bacterium]|nr:MAG: tyrosine recombinase [Bacteroidota bacterium]
MKWEILRKGYHAWLLMERGLSKASIKAYISDIQTFVDYSSLNNMPSPERADSVHLARFIAQLGADELSIATQARMVSALRSFYNYLLLENIVTENPALLLEIPSRGRHLPDVLSVEEVYQIIHIIDLSTTHGERDKAIIETLYGCGLRVSELTSLRISNLHFKEEFIKIVGKGNKERLVPLGSSAAAQIKRYLYNVRNRQKIAPECEDILFLNQRGKALSRVSIFTMVKRYSELCGIRKNVSPHSFRHSFATHLIEGGASLRAVQQMLGHVSITTTEIYTHVSNRYLRDAIMQFHPMEKKKPL